MPRCVDYVLIPLMMLLPAEPAPPRHQQSQQQQQQQQAAQPPLPDRVIELSLRCVSALFLSVGGEGFCCEAAAPSKQQSPPGAGGVEAEKDGDSEPVAAMGRVDDVLQRAFVTLVDAVVDANHVNALPPAANSGSQLNRHQKQRHQPSVSEERLCAALDVLWLVAGHIGGLGRGKGQLHSTSSGLPTPSPPSAAAKPSSVERLDVTTATAVSAVRSSIAIGVEASDGVDDDDGTGRVGGGASDGMAGLLADLDFPRTATKQSNAGDVSSTSAAPLPSSTSQLAAVQASLFSLSLHHDHHHHQQQQQYAPRGRPFTHSLPPFLSQPDFVGTTISILMDVIAVEGPWVASGGGGRERQQGAAQHQQRQRQPGRLSRGTRLAAVRALAALMAALAHAPPLLPDGGAAPQARGFDSQSSLLTQPSKAAAGTNGNSDNSDTVTPGPHLLAPFLPGILTGLLRVLVPPPTQVSSSSASGSGGSAAGNRSGAGGTGGAGHERTGSQLLSACAHAMRIALSLCVSDGVRDRHCPPAVAAADLVSSSAAATLPSPDRSRLGLVSDPAWWSLTTAKTAQMMRILCEAIARGGGGGGGFATPASSSSSSTVVGQGSQLSAAVTLALRRLLRCVGTQCRGTLAAAVPCCIDAYLLLGGAECEDGDGEDGSAWLADDFSHTATTADGASTGAAPPTTSPSTSAAVLGTALAELPDVLLRRGSTARGMNDGRNGSLVSTAASSSSGVPSAAPRRHHHDRMLSSSPSWCVWGGTRDRPETYLRLLSLRLDLVLHQRPPAAESPVELQQQQHEGEQGRAWPVLLAFSQAWRASLTVPTASVVVSRLAACLVTSLVPCPLALLHLLPETSRSSSSASAPSALASTSPSSAPSQASLQSAFPPLPFYAACDVDALASRADGSGSGSGGSGYRPAGGGTESMLLQIAAGSSSSQSSTTVVRPLDAGLIQALVALLCGQHHRRADDASAAASGSSGGLVAVLGPVHSKDLLLHLAGRYIAASGDGHDNDNGDGDVTVASHSSGEERLSLDGLSSTATSGVASSSAAAAGGPAPTALSPGAAQALWLCAHIITACHAQYTAAVATLLLAQAAAKARPQPTTAAAVAPSSARPEPSATAPLSSVSPMAALQAARSWADAIAAASKVLVPACVAGLKQLAAATAGDGGNGREDGGGSGVGSSVEVHRWRSLVAAESCRCLAAVAVACGRATTIYLHSVLPPLLALATTAGSGSGSAYSSAAAAASLALQAIAASTQPTGGTASAAALTAAGNKYPSAAAVAEACYRLLPLPKPVMGVPAASAPAPAAVALPAVPAVHLRPPSSASAGPVAAASSSLALAATGHPPYDNAAGDGGVLALVPHHTSTGVLALPRPVQLMLSVHVNSLVDNVTSQMRALAVALQQPQQQKQVQALQVASLSHVPRLASVLVANLILQHQQQRQPTTASSSSPVPLLLDVSSSVRHVLAAASAASSSSAVSPSVAGNNNGRRGLDHLRHQNSHAEATHTRLHLANELLQTLDTVICAAAVLDSGSVTGCGTGAIGGGVYPEGGVPVMPDPEQVMRDAGDDEEDDGENEAEKDDGHADGDDGGGAPRPGPRLSSKLIGALRTVASAAATDAITAGGSASASPSPPQPTGSADGHPYPYRPSKADTRNAAIAAALSSCLPYLSVPARDLLVRTMLAAGQYVSSAAAAFAPSAEPDHQGDGGQWGTGRVPLSQLRLTLSALSCLLNGSEALARHPDTLYPLLHSLWPSVVALLPSASFASSGGATSSSSSSSSAAIQVLMPIPMREGAHNCRGAGTQPASSSTSRPQSRQQHQSMPRQHQQQQPSQIDVLMVQTRSFMQHRAAVLAAGTNSSSGGSGRTSSSKAGRPSASRARVHRSVATLSVIDGGGVADDGDTDADGFGRAGGLPGSRLVVELSSSNAHSRGGGSSNNNIIGGGYGSGAMSAAATTTSSSASLLTLLVHTAAIEQVTCLASAPVDDLDDDGGTTTGATGVAGGEATPGVVAGYLSRLDTPQRQSPQRVRGACAGDFLRSRFSADVWPRLRAVLMAAAIAAAGADSASSSSSGGGGNDPATKLHLAAINCVARLCQPLVTITRLSAQETEAAAGVSIGSGQAYTPAVPYASDVPQSDISGISSTSGKGGSGARVGVDGDGDDDAAAAAPASAAPVATHFTVDAPLIRSQVWEAACCVAAILGATASAAAAAAVPASSAASTASTPAPVPAAASPPFASSHPLAAAARVCLAALCRVDPHAVSLAADYYGVQV